VHRVTTSTLDLGQPMGGRSLTELWLLTFGTPRASQVTTRYMTKYEKARVLGTRALQIRRVPGVARVTAAVSVASFFCAA